MSQLCCSILLLKDGRLLSSGRLCDSLVTGQICTDCLHNSSNVGPLIMPLLALLLSWAQDNQARSDVRRVVMSGLELIAGSGCCGPGPAPLSGAEPQRRSWLPLLGLPLLPVSTPPFSASTGSFLHSGRIKDTLGLPLLAQSTADSHVGAQVQMLVQQ